MKSKISNLFRIKESINEKEGTSVVNSIDDLDHQTSLTYRQSGFSDSQNSAGNFINFGQELERIYERFKKQCREDETLQEKLRTPHLAKLETCKSEKSNLQTLVKIKNGDAEIIQTEIDTITQKIEEIKQDPKSHGIPADRKPEVQFYLGLFLLVPITIYLLVFYISASYSGFFKAFGADASVTAAIFDSNALGKALKDGWLEFIFVSTIPFAFMGLGYLIHMFQKTTSKLRYLKIVGLVVVTFIFDAILAYLIESKIFEVTKTLEQVFGIKEAINSTGFWGIIFAGFVVYMIWGLVLDFVLKEHENKDKVKLAINAEKQLIERKELRLSELKMDLTNLHAKISDCDVRIIEEQSSIDGIMIPVRQYLAYHQEYASGWFSYIAGHLALTEERQHKLLQSCGNVSAKFIEDKELKLADDETIKLSVA
ncbi:MAG: hypothetical protein ACI9K1_000358 [Arcticibacterium sp.]|jgi:hypothetical protein